MFGDHTFATLDALVSQALDLAEDQRAEFLAELTSKDPELARRLVRLLGRMHNASQFLEGNAERARDEILVKSLEHLRNTGCEGELAAGSKIGPYTIEDVIGRGLRATVYLASREEEGWSQRVAIKLMARGVNTDDVLRRFFAERQILTELRYPSICTLLDGGVTNDGLPYFVMEYIDGETITGYCHSRALGLEDRLRLFLDVCGAVGQAHRHMVVHRDIKPANILVTNEGQVKLLDFGIAKLLEPGSAQSAAVTHLDTRPMTPAFTSPEQLAGEPVTTATDVYQLGLLLTATICATETPRKALGIKDGAAPESEPSRVEPDDGQSLPYPRKSLRGDLDWIVLKCLETDPARRYGSAEELRSDISRFLESRPVSARRATFPYLTRKFVRRRPGLALAAAITLLGVVAFVGLLAYFNVQLSHERTEALESATRAEETKSLLVRFLSSADPYQGSGADTRVSELLEDAERVTVEELSHRPELQAELFGTLADVYSGLSLHAQSARMRTAQLELIKQMGNADSLEALHARRRLALSLAGVNPTEETLAELETIREDLATLQPDAWLERARINHDIGSLLHVYGRDEDAEPYAQRAVEILKTSADSPIDLANALLSLGSISHDNQERLGYHQQAADVLSHHFGPQHPRTLSAEITVASTLSDLSRFEESLEIFNRIIPELERELGPLHDQTVEALNNRAVCLSRMGDDAAAIEGFREALARDRQVHGDQHRSIANRQQNLGAMLNRMGRYPEAIEALTEAARIYQAVNLPGNYSTAFPHITLADIYGKTGDADLLEFHARRALELLTGNLPDNHHAILKSRCLLGDALIRQGQEVEGRELVQSALDDLEGQSVPNPTLAAECAALLES